MITLSDILVLAFQIRSQKCELVSKKKTASNLASGLFWYC